MPILKGQPKEQVNVHGKDLVATEQGLILADHATAAVLENIGFKRVPDRRVVADPLNTDDEKKGFHFGTVTQNIVTGAHFVCVDSTPAAAKHTQVQSLTEAHTLLGLAVPGGTEGGVPTTTPPSTAPDGEVPPNPVIEAGRETEMLVGSSVQPSTFKLVNGKEITLGDVVRQAFVNSRLKTVAEFNALPDEKRENLIEAAKGSFDIAPEDTDKLGFGKGA